MRPRFAPLVVSLFALAGCRRDPVASLSNPEQLTLYSLHGQGHDAPPPTGEQFHGVQVLGKVDVTDAGRREELVAALKSGAAAPPKFTATCFLPRHGLRVIEAGKTVDFVVCFECFKFETYQGDSSELRNISREAQPAFDAVLTAAGVTLAPKPPR